MLNLKGRRVILASNSPRRRELLAGLGIDFTIDTQSSFEESPEPGVDPVQVPMDMSVGKSHGFHRELESDEILITGPTTGAVMQTVDEIRVELKPVEKTTKGERFSIKVNEKIRPSDRLYKMEHVQLEKSFE